MSKGINILMAIWALLTLRLMVSLVVLAVVLFMIVPAVGAQDVPGAVDTSPVITPIPFEKAVEMLVATVTAIFGSAIPLGITTFLVSVLKRIPALDKIGASGLAVGVAAVLTIAAWISQMVGVQVEFNSFLRFLEVSGPALYQFIVTLAGSTLLYKGLRQVGAPLVGKSRDDISNRLRRELGQG